MGLDSVTSTGPLLSLNLVRGLGSQTVAVLVKVFSCEGVCVYLGPRRLPAWGEIWNPVLKVRDLHSGWTVVVTW